jgi:hypothetical protein
MSIAGMASVGTAWPPPLGDDEPPSGDEEPPLGDDEPPSGDDDPPDGEDAPPVGGGVVDELSSPPPPQAQVTAAAMIEMASAFEVEAVQREEETLMSCIPEWSPAAVGKRRS